MLSRASTSSRAVDPLGGESHSFLIVEHPTFRKGQGYCGPCCPGHAAGFSWASSICMTSYWTGPWKNKRPALADRVLCFYDMQGAGLRQVEASRRSSETRPPRRPFHEMALVAKTVAQGTEAHRKPQAPGTGDSQGDPCRDLRRLPLLFGGDYARGANPQSNYLN
jgi:hypothetical protein